MSHVPPDAAFARPVRGSRFVGAGLGLQLALYADGRVEGVVALPDACQGPPGLAHGGALAALLDEAMSAAAWVSGHRIVAASLDVRFLAPVPLGQPVRVVGRVAGVDGRKVVARGELTLADGALAASAESLLVVAPQFFDAADGFALE